MSFFELGKIKFKVPKVRLPKVRAGRAFPKPRIRKPAGEKIKGFSLTIFSSGKAPKNIKKIDIIRALDIIMALIENNGDKARASQILGIDAAKLNRHIANLRKLPQEKLADYASKLNISLERLQELLAGKSPKKGASKAPSRKLKKPEGQNTVNAAPPYDPVAPKIREPEKIYTANWIEGHPDTLAIARKYSRTIPREYIVHFASIFLYELKRMERDDCYLSNLLKQDKRAFEAVVERFAIRALWDTKEKILNEYIFNEVSSFYETTSKKSNITALAGLKIFLDKLPLHDKFKFYETLHNINLEIKNAKDKFESQLAITKFQKVISTLESVPKIKFLKEGLAPADFSNRTKNINEFFAIAAKELDEWDEKQVRREQAMDKKMPFIDDFPHSKVRDAYFIPLRTVDYISKIFRGRSVKKLAADKVLLARLSIRINKEFYINNAANILHDLFFLRLKKNINMRYICDFISELYTRGETAKADELGDEIRLFAARVKNIQSTEEAENLYNAFCETVLPKIK